MRKEKILSSTALALCMCLVLAVPAYAGNGNMQPMQNSMNTNTNMNTNMNMNMNNAMNGNNTSNMQLQQSSMMQNATFSNAAQFMINKGIMKGDTNGNYDLSANVKRCDMSVMLVRAFDFDTESDNGDSFADVSESSYYYDAVNTIQQMGIAKGDGTNFNPGRYMTLQEAIWFVERAMDSAGTEYSNEDLEAVFSDRSLSEYATREDVSALLYAALGEDYEQSESSEAASITYKADANTAITFDEDDFNSVCEDATDETLNYVKFDLPSTSFGKLYFDYESSSSYDSIVASSSKYYYDADDDQRSISDVTFVPKTNYVGTVTINYTGYNAEGTSFNGTVKLTINEDDITADTITYTTDQDTAVSFDEDDFNSVCEDASGATLSYIKFYLPSTTYGKLYYDYESSDDLGTRVASTTKFYYDDDDSLSISDVTFVPNSSFTGTAKITYIGLNEDGETITGTIKITVE